MKAKPSLLFVLGALLLAGLACNFTGVRETNTPRVPVSTEAVESLEENLNRAAEQAQSTGDVTIVVDEAQLTSLVAFELQKQQDPILTDPQIYLRDGQVQLHGEVNQGGLRAPLVMNMAVSVDGQGKPQYEVVSAKLGPFPLPDSILDQMTAQIDQAFAQEIGPEVEQMNIESIIIADGRMTIQGQAR